MKYSAALLLALVAGAEAAGKPKFSVGLGEPMKIRSTFGAVAAMLLLMLGARSLRAVI